MNDLTASKPIPFTKLALIKRFRVVDPDEMDDEENLHINDDDEMMSSEHMPISVESSQIIWTSH